MKKRQEGKGLTLNSPGYRWKCGLSDILEHITRKFCSDCISRRSLIQIKTSSGFYTTIESLCGILTICLSRTNYLAGTVSRLKDPIKGLEALAAGALAQSALKIQVTKDTTHAIPSTLYGYMWEDINHSGDGGLYGELLQNRAFQAVSPHTSEALTAWSAYRGATIDVTNNTPGVSTALPNSLQVAVPTGVTESVGFQNSGYWGIKVQSGWKYTGSLYAKSDSYTGSVTVSLVSESGTTYATKTLKGVSSSWRKFTFEFKPTKSAPNNNNFFRVTVDGSSAAGKNVYFGLLSLFPPTYRNRPNGMRVDLAEALAATKPGVWRFPGGNNLEGMAHLCLDHDCT
ncbi:glycoside hydrolase family 51 protein [Rhizoctonia solani AG-1 IA]|uniref:Glycoside hydrolase family 51 protein n=1 Tax=Thanatephorus cucumeris (strain AG1-IA) TaxID=983506 RepID=L8WQR0_THACA|nr:glycoside hydrolase family 51 protein [Rhizoctonia solani AG-1 IA]